jgi:hypothetical protein
MAPLRVQSQFSYREAAYCLAFLVRLDPQAARDAHTTSQKFGFPVVSAMISMFLDRSDFHPFGDF